MKDAITYLLALGLPFVIAQAIGPVTTVLSVLSAQMKNITAILITELAANFLVALSYILLGGISGFSICLSACLQIIFSFVYAKKEKRVPKLLTVVFILLYVALSVIFYQTPMDILPCLCAVGFALSVAQSKPAGYRFFMSICTALWIVYDILISAWGMLITHGLLLTSLVVAIVRQDVKKRSSNSV